MADANHYAEAADGLQAAAKALRACGEEESSEYETGSKPQNLRDAAQETRARFRRDRAAS